MFNYGKISDGMSGIVYLNKYLMRKCALVLISILFIQANLYAQQAGSSIFKGAGGYLTYGLYFLDISSLNDDLRKYDLPALGTTQMGIGAGGGAFIKRFYLGGQGVMQFGASASNELYKTKLFGGYGMVQGGYTLVQTPSIAFYPTLGLGGGGTLVRIDEGPNYVAQNDGTLLQPDNSMHAGYMLLDLGVNCDFYISAGKSGTGKILIGISAGYQLHPYITNWSFEEQEISGLEKFAPNGFYVKVKLGWGSFI